MGKAPNACKNHAGDGKTGMACFYSMITDVPKISHHVHEAVAPTIEFDEVLDDLGTTWYSTKDDRSVTDVRKNSANSRT
ncbi:hypothetical protein NPX13_g4739 [Xylaria arbuscula]|uniref:Uncharacterized protein n=1 Tax=Xylaria arbuscula TaxID=114810 RepID=A0A9W8NG72_9PEZI|nr:hypothetical protein NPX13_g4739 [Xylaria arbuscula]